MKFAVEATTKYSGRLGNLFYQTENGSMQKFQTPLFIHSTKGGSIPYLSKEAFSYVTSDTQILQISLSSTDHMEEALNHFKNGIGEYVGFKESPVFVSFRDPIEIAPSGFHEKDIVPMFTRRGKQVIDSKRYMSLMESMKPNLYQTLCDADTCSESSKNRIQKSIDRTEQFFKECLEIHKNSATLSNTSLVASIVGGYCAFSRSLSIKTILPHSEVMGFAIEGLHNYGNTAMDVKLEPLREIVAHTVKQLPNTKMKIMYGAYNPLTVLELICLGVDIFDSSYINIATLNFKALTFSFDVDTSNDEEQAFCIDLNDDKYKEDFTPFLENCACLTCRQHTKAYVNHLVKTRELLAPILLQIHNTQHYMNFFDKIREAVLKDELPKLIAILKKQIINDVDGKSLIIDAKTNVEETKTANSKEKKKRY